MKRTLKRNRWMMELAASLVAYPGVLACTTDDDPLEPDAGHELDSGLADSGLADSGLADSGLADLDASLPRTDGGGELPEGGGIALDAHVPDTWLDGAVIIPADAAMRDADIPPLDSGVDQEPEVGFEVDFAFSEGGHGWEAGFADFFPDMESGMDLVGGFQAADETPAEVGAAFALHGSNTSDDLFMFMKKRLSSNDGILVDQTYRLRFSVVLHSNAPSDCVGIGGAPGESVYLKAGASGVEPQAVLTGDGGLTQLRMNINKGNQSSGGEAAEVMGNIANGVACEQMPTGYVQVERIHEMDQLIQSNADGELWVFLGTDSGFEGRTELYVESIRVEGLGDLGLPE